MTKSNINLTPEQRRAIMEKLYGEQLALERIVQMKMDIHILNQSEDNSPKLKQQLQLWESVINTELELRLGLATSVTMPKSDKNMQFKDALNLNVYANNEFIILSRSHNFYVLTQTTSEYEKIEIENSEPILIKTEKTKPISELPLYITNSSNAPDFNLRNSEGKDLIYFSTYSDRTDWIRLFRVRCIKCSIWQDPSSDITKYHGSFLTTFMKALPIKCSYCHKTLMWERQPKQSVSAPAYNLAQTFPKMGVGI